MAKTLGNREQIWRGMGRWSNQQIGAERAVLKGVLPASRGQDLLPLLLDDTCCVMLPTRSGPPFVPEQHNGLLFQSQSRARSDIGTENQALR